MVISKPLFASVLKNTESLRRWDQFWAHMGLFLLTPLHSKTYCMLNILFMYGNKCLIGSIEHSNIWILKRRVIQLYTVYLCIIRYIFKWKSGYVGQFINSSNGRDRFFRNLLLMPKSLGKDVSDSEFQSSFGWSNLDRWHNPVVART